MGKKSLKTGGSAGSKKNKGAASAKLANGVLVPNQVQRGIYLYQRVAGSVYVRYRETTKKVVGVSRLVNDEFLDASITDLINALESKDRK